MDVSEVTQEREDELLDDRELDEPAAGDADPIHLARCAECATAVRYRSNITGSGFFLVDADPDAVFGIGPNGRPVCPGGHGEMAVADDRLVPAADAFAEVQALQEAVQGSLPGVFPAFNFQGAYLELEEQALRVDRLHKEHKEAAETAREAKKEWDKAAELYTAMALTLRRRRQDKDAGIEPAAATPARTPCTWEERHPGETCPLCSGETVPFVVTAHLGDPSRLASPDALAHIDDVEKLLLGLDVEAVVEALENVDTYITADVVAIWTSAERMTVSGWADAMLDKQSGAATSSDAPARPEVLGKPHIPAAPVAGAPQVCQFCEVVIRAADDDDHEPFKVTDYVGTDCKGKPASVGHHYPKSQKAAPAKGSKKKGAKR